MLNSSLLRRKRTIQVFLFLSVTYIIIVLCILVFCRSSQLAEYGRSYDSYPDFLVRNIQLVPFTTIQEMLKLSVNRNVSIYARSLAAINVIGNIVIFLPVGVLFPIAIARLQKLKQYFVFTVLLTLCIELLQLFTARGAFDIDDVLLNCVGALIGFAIYKGSLRKLDKKKV